MYCIINLWVLLLTYKEDKRMKQEKIVLQKNTEKTTNKMRIPKFFVDKFGRKFYMEIYDDYIKLIPIKKEK